MKVPSVNVSTRDDVESGTSNDELKALFQEEEVRELKTRLALERSKCNKLMRVIEKKVLEKQKSYRLVVRFAADLI